jgi:tetratricopeptide (TPR) repeat protein
MTDTAPHKQQPHITAMAIFLLAFVAFAPALANGFVAYDDPGYVTKNETVQRGLTIEGIRWAFTTGFFSNWHPLTWISHMIDYQLYEDWAAGHHLTNILFHAANAALLFLALRALTGQAGPCAIAALLFAVHPLRAESVAWIAERKDVLSSFFWITAMYTYARYAKRPGAPWYAATALCLALGLMAKPMLVTLPCVLLLLDYWPLKRIAFDANAPRRAFILFAEKIPLFALAIASCVITYQVQASYGTVVSTETVEFSVRANNAVYSYWAGYLGKFLWPTHLAFYYPHLGRILSTPVIITCAASIIISSIIALAILRRAPHLAVGWFWYLGTLVPVIGLVQVGGAGMADRYTYIPHIGIAIIIAWTLAACVKAWPRTMPIVTGATVLSLVILFSLSWHQSKTWHNSETLYRHAIAVTPLNPQANFLLSEELVRQNRIREAMEELQRTITYSSSHYRAHNNLGALLVREGNEAQAIIHFLTAIDIEPAFPRPHINYAKILMERKEYADAYTHALAAYRFMGGNESEYAALEELLTWLRSQPEVQSASPTTGSP